MRDRSSWHQPILKQLAGTWPTGLAGFQPGSLCDVELGLYLLDQVMPGRTAADAWTLFGGYPYGEALGDVRTGQQRLLIRRARHYLWPMRRRRVWRAALTGYLDVPQELRGYDLAGIDAMPERRAPARAASRFDVYERLLAAPPAFARAALPLAAAGEYWFPQRDRRHAVTFTSGLAAGPEPAGHDLGPAPASRASALEVTWAELEAAASEMDAVEAGIPDGQLSDWALRLGRVRLMIRSEAGREFVTGDRLRIDELLHLVGMVGAGKSTLRDILAFRAAQRGLRITIVVGDVAETLAIVNQFARLGVSAAPILGQSTRERHIKRLHRRVATAGAPTMLAHAHPGFAYLSSACPLDALRGLEAAEPLRIGEAPCSRLYPASMPADPLALLADSKHLGSAGDGPDAQPEEKMPKRHGCPLWTRCPRHHGARELVEARIWVATPASLVHTGVPQHQNAEQLRYLELACRRSDLVIVDEADRVQMHLDAAFAPATTLVGRSPDSWLDEVQGHKITELARRGRIQLSEQEIDDWANALNTVSAATDRLYALLVQNTALRTWVIEDYFSAFTLHLRLLNEWFPELKHNDGDAPPSAEREARGQRSATVSAILDRFRDSPLEYQPVTADAAEIAPAANDLVHLTLELLHAPRSATTRQRLHDMLVALVGPDPRIEQEMASHALQFEFTLLLAALHHSLDFMTTLWSRVEAALNLESTSNVLSRRPPRDYEPLIPESPMGNVLGFQFRLDDRARHPEQSGELRFFRCSGIGRELLLGLHELPVIDGRPGPKVLLMSATSWAGSSSRYHVHVPVGAILRPHDDEVKAILETDFRKEFLYSPNGAALRLSGSDPAVRHRVLEQMLQQLAESDRALIGATSKLQDELSDIPDPGRRRVLLLVGSYAEAWRAGEYLNRIPEWTGRITVLVSDDTDLDDAWRALPGDPSARALRRGDVASFPKEGGEILVAPLLAVERGHNIVLPGGKAAIGTAYFLARPHPRPDDIALAIQAVNDWAVRFVRDGEFRQMALAAGSPDAAGLKFRALARRRWQRLLTRTLAWSSLPEDEKTSFTWDQLVVIWQVIGRLVRGGVPARAVFVDAAFSPNEAGLTATDTPATSLLLSMRSVLEPYFTGDPPATEIDRSLVGALYEPLYRALAEID